jgi:hypothetical protein
MVVALVRLQTGAARSAVSARANASLADLRSIDRPDATKCDVTPDDASVRRRTTDARTFFIEDHACVVFS